MYWGPLAGGGYTCLTRLRYSSWETPTIYLGVLKLKNWFISAFLFRVSVFGSSHFLRNPLEVRELLSRVASRAVRSQSDGLRQHLHSTAFTVCAKSENLILMINLKRGGAPNLKFQKVSIWEGPESEFKDSKTKLLKLILKFLNWLFAVGVQ